MSCQAGVKSARPNKSAPLKPAANKHAFCKEGSPWHHKVEKTVQLCGIDMPRPLLGATFLPSYQPGPGTLWRPHLQGALLSSIPPWLVYDFHSGWGSVDSTCMVSDFLELFIACWFLLPSTMAHSSSLKFPEERGIKPTNPLCNWGKTNVKRLNQVLNNGIRVQLTDGFTISTALQT